MQPAKCPCCDGYGSRARPAHLPGDGPLACVSCNGTGLVWGVAFAPPVYVPAVAPAPFDPWLTQPPPFMSPTITWRVGGEPMPPCDTHYTLTTGAQ